MPLEYYEFKLHERKVIQSRGDFHEVVRDLADQCAGKREVYMVEVINENTWPGWTIRVHLKD
jgi:hypothetical protein